MKNPTCILVTGPGHSATRLLGQVLSRHPEIDGRVELLNGVGEYEPWRQYCHLMLDRMSLASANYPIKTDELAFILNAFRAGTDPGCKYFVLKEPFFPLVCMSQIVEIFGPDTVLLYSQRPAEKIVRSFINRDEHKDLAKDLSGMLLQKAKRLSLEDRQDWISSLDPVDYFQRYVRRCESLRQKWDQANPRHPFFGVDIERLARDPGYLPSLLAHMGLDPQPAERMCEVINQKRLLNHSGKHFQRLQRTIWRLRQRVRSL